MTPDFSLAERLFATLARRTRRGRGIERDTYGEGEQAGHDIARDAAVALGLEVAVDAIGNLAMTLPGRDRAAPGVIVGSHLDSVPQGGNFDGAAGVVAGLAALSGFRAAGVVPPFDIAVMAIRGEESAWFDAAYIGSLGALGRLDPAALDVRRRDTGETLAATLSARGFDPDAIRERRLLLDRARVRAFLELHIEQGPVLVHAGLPAAAVTGIRGCRRFRNATCTGRYGHSGALPRQHRSDAVAATVALLHHMRGVWLEREAAACDLVLTSGEFTTNPALHGPSKVAGETRFVLDIRSLSDAVMDAVADAAREAAGRIGEEYRVRFDLGETSDSPPALMDPRLVAAFRQPFQMASGAGHDAAVFAAAGVPSGMIFVRNEHGSHNPDEAMDLADFAVAARALSAVLLDFPF